jgi:hypothetical protein
MLLAGRVLKTSGLSPLAVHVGSWHVHIVLPYVNAAIETVVKSVKDGIRRGLKYRRPIWTAGYDRRFCFDDSSLQNRVEYVQRHNVRDGLPQRPWMDEVPGR